MPATKPISVARLATAVVLGVAALIGGPTGRALASCVGPPDPVAAVNSADIVFVGKVTNVSSFGRTAVVSVLEVWRGPDQPATVTINEGLADTTATSVDRTFVAGETYLFFPYLSPDSGKLTDNSCSSTMAFDTAASDLRPPDARPPIGGPPLAPAGFDLGPLLPVGVALLVFAVLLVVGLLARGRQET